MLNEVSSPWPVLSHLPSVICLLTTLFVCRSGAWIHPAKGSEEFPWINVVAADPGSDAYYRPLVLDQFPTSSFRFVDDTIFLYGRDPTNRPSWTMNNLLPLHRYDQYERIRHGQIDIEIGPFMFLCNTSLCADFISFNMYLGIV
jgi:hypothetical protein